MALTIATTHTKTLVSPSTGAEDKVYGTDYVSATSHSAALSGILDTANGGTGIAYFTVAGPTVARIYTFPDDAATIARTDAANTFIGVQTFSTPIATGSVAAMSATVGGGVPTPPNNTTTFLRGDGTFAAPAGAAALSGITAATGAATIGSGNNTGIVWNWANTTDTTVAFRLGETTAATGGTSTAGVPNQVLLRLDTIAASTMSPLSVYSRAAHVFSVSPTSAQMMLASGTAAAPIIASAADAGGGGTGFYRSASGAWSFTSASTKSVTFSGYGLEAGGTPSSPGILDIAGNFNGFFLGSTFVGVSLAGLENNRWLGATGTQQWQVSNAGAVTTAYAANFRKARGTVAAPTVITTGDDLATISGFGYVGATNTYQEAARITFDSAGTIADSLTGITGLIRFLTASAANALEPTDRFHIDDNQAAAETALLVSVAGVAPQRVSIGAADSGGAGFRLMRVAN